MYNIVHDMTNQSQNVLNVYQVERANAGETAGSISDGFQTSILPILRLFQTVGVVNNELRIFNLGDPLDFGTFTLSAAAGLRAIAQSPSFQAGEIKFPSINRDVRHGFKRFCGVSEDDVTAGVLVAAAITLLDNIGDAMIGNWLSSVDSHIICNFVIVKRICTTVPPPGSPCPSYRLPEIGDTLTFYTPTNRITLTTARSQVSRRQPT